MATKNFRRQALEDLGVTDEKTIDKIMDLYHEIVDPIKDERDKYKAEAETVPELERAKADLESKLKTAETERDDFKTKHDTEKAEHDKLKADIAGKETLAKKESALRDELKSKKYSDDAVKLILSKGGYTDKIELDKDGKPKNIDSIFADIQTDFAMFTPKETVTSSKPDTPPVNAGGNTFEGMTLGEKMKYANENPTDRAVLNWLNKK